MTKCIYCGKEFKPKEGKKYCSEDCSYFCRVEKAKIKYLIRSIAKRYNFQIKNLDEIIDKRSLKLIKKGIYKCSYDINNSERFCGSALCIADVVYKGYCHCHLFWNKKLPQINDVEILKKKLLQIKPELKDWIENNF